MSTKENLNENQESVRFLQMQCLIEELDSLRLDLLKIQSKEARQPYLSRFPTQRATAILQIEKVHEQLHLLVRSVPAFEHPRYFPLFLLYQNVHQRLFEDNDGSLKIVSNSAYQTALNQEFKGGEQMIREQECVGHEPALQMHPNQSDESKANEKTRLLEMEKLLLDTGQLFQDLKYLTIAQQADLHKIQDSMDSTKAEVETALEQVSFAAGTNQSQRKAFLWISTVMGAALLGVSFVVAPIGTLTGLSSLAMYTMKSKVTFYSISYTSNTWLCNL